MIVAAMILQISCQQDDSFHPTVDSTIINLSVSAANSGTTMDNDDTASAIKSLCILQFNANENDFGTLRHVGVGQEVVPNSGKYSATLLQSVDNNDKYKLVILANFPDGDYSIFRSIVGKDYAAVQNACLSAELIGNDTVLTFDGMRPFPMFGLASDGNPLLINETMDLGPVSLVRAVARVDIGVGTKNADNTWNKGYVKFNMTAVQIWKAGKQYAYMPAANNFSSAVGTLTISKPSPAGTTETKVYGTTYIISGTYCADKIYLPEALLWQTDNSAVYDKDHKDRLAIIVEGYYNNLMKKTYYRVDFINDQTGAKMDILRNHVYQFSITSVTDEGYDSAELAYNSGLANLSFTASLAPWQSGVTATVPNILGYHISYGGLNGTVTTFGTLTIPKKKDIFVNTNYPFDYDRFYGEANSLWAIQSDPGERNGWLYDTVEKAFTYEGTCPTLMVSGDDVLSSEATDNEHIPWKKDGVLTAFDICRDYGGQGYNDWRLPRLSELALVYSNKASLEAMRGFTATTADSYWSGSEYLEGPLESNKRGSNSVWAINLGTGAAEHHLKTDRLKIRCVRSVKGMNANTLK